MPTNPGPLSDTHLNRLREALIPGRREIDVTASELRALLDEVEHNRIPAIDLSEPAARTRTIPTPAAALAQYKALVEAHAADMPGAVEDWTFYACSVNKHLQDQMTQTLWPSEPAVARDRHEQGLPCAFCAPVFPTSNIRPTNAVTRSFTLWSCAVIVACRSSNLFCRPLGVNRTSVGPSPSASSWASASTSRPPATCRSGCNPCASPATPSSSPRGSWRLQPCCGSRSAVSAADRRTDPSMASPGRSSASPSCSASSTPSARAARSPAASSPNPRRPTWPPSPPTSPPSCATPSRTAA